MVLEGKRVLVTRAAHQAEELCEPLRRAGAFAYLAPAVSIEPPADPTPLLRAVERLGEFAWVAFTSQNGVERLLTALGGRGWPSGVRIAAVGRTTGATLERAGLVPDLIASGTGAALAAELGAKVKGLPVLVPGPEEGREELPAGLAAAGARVTTVPAYRTVAATRPDPALCAALDRGEIFAGTLASPSAARGLCALGAPVRETLARLPVAVVGPTTKEAARALGLRVVAQAARPSMEALVEALAAWAAERRGLEPDPR